MVRVTAAPRSSSSYRQRTGSPRAFAFALIHSVVIIAPVRARTFSVLLTHVLGCQNYNDVAERNRVYFKTEAEALAAGFRKARNCS